MAPHRPAATRPRIFRMSTVRAAARPSSTMVTRPMAAGIWVKSFRAEA